MTARQVSVTAISIALVALFVLIVRIPVPATGGYWHLGVVAEVFVSLAFGPFLGAVASGVGAALADVLSGFSSFAPLTLIAHGSTGLVVGWLGWRRGWRAMILGWLLGGLSQVALYFVGEATFYGFGMAAAAAELPGNLVQVGLGLAGILLLRRVRLSYPQLDQLFSGHDFEAE